MSAVKRIDADECASRMDYLKHTAGADLAYEERRAERADNNPAKTIETLRLIAKHARECALYLEREDTDT